MYHTVPITHYYWLDDTDKEFKEKIFGLLSYRITGPFRVAIFKKTIAYLIHRHEDLRSTFHRMNDRFYLRVEDPDSSRFEVEFMDMRGCLLPAERSEDHPLHFPGHSFDLAAGPLIAVRLLQIKDSEFILSIKLHHAIYDAWSLEVLIRDMETAYVAFSEDKEPDLPVLDRQLRDFMALITTLRETNYAADMAYWESRYPNLPGDLNIPGACPRSSPVWCRPGKEKYFNLPRRMPDRLREVAGKCSTTTFIILQSLLNLYMAKMSGQYDLVLGMLVYGRDELPGSEDQLGFYARMLLIRTQMDTNDGFEAVVRKVKRSNEEMRNHRACSLLEAMAQKVEAKPGMQNSFWKIDIEYSDGFGYRIETEPGEQPDESELQFHRISRGHIETVMLQTELKLHFYILKNGPYIDVKYDSGLFTVAAIDQLMNGFLEFADRQIDRILQGGPVILSQ